MILSYIVTTIFYMPHSMHITGKTLAFCDVFSIVEHAYEIYTI